MVRVVVIRDSGNGGSCYGNGCGSGVIFLVLMVVIMVVKDVLMLVL